MSARDTTRPQIRVLAADYDGNNLTVLNALLRAAGHQVFLASSAEECIRVAQKVLPDVVLLDIDMPGMDGYEAAAALSGAEETRSIPIVMVTALTG